MKNLFLSAIFASLSVLPLAANTASLPVSNNDPLIVRSYFGVMGLELTLANLEQVPTRVTLTSLATGTPYLLETIREHNGYSMNLYLEKLPKGRYLLTIRKGDSSRQQVLLKTADGVRCSDWVAR